jgi:hypothetical protein
MAARHVTIGPEFFIKAKKDYTDWRFALVREFFQNCIDCGSSQIVVECHEGDGVTKLSVTNNGESMTESILLDKLLSLGSSGKNFEGTTGGFGKAKELLYMCHDEYRIHSGTLVVEGSGAAYDLQTDAEFFGGTRSDIVIEGYHESELLSAIRKFIGFAQWDGVFVINGDTEKGDLRKGSPRRDLGFGMVYSNRSFSYQMVVRINGIPMFSKGIGLDRCVVVELKGKSDEILTANRDGLLEPFSGELSSFVTELSVDKRSALKARQPRYIQYRGTKMCHVRSLNVLDVVEPVVDCVGSPVPMMPAVDVCVNAELVPGASAASMVAWSVAAKAMAAAEKTPKSKLGMNFILKNETDLKIPAYYDPGTGEFSEYSRKLVRIWGRLMVEMHRLFDAEAEFSIGFVFDEESEAEFENGGYGQVYYLNPCKIKEQKYSYSKSFQKRFKLTERGRLIAIAAHEFVHGLGMGWHDESYANKLTDVLGVVLSSSSRFAWCFK